GWKPFPGWIGNVRISRRLVFGNDDRAVAAPRVIDEKTPVGRILWMKSEAEKTLFATGNDFRMNIEKERRRRRPALKHANRSTLLDNEKTIRAVTRVGDECRAGKSCDDRRQLNRRENRRCQAKQQRDSETAHDLRNLNGGRSPSCNGFVV